MYIQQRKRLETAQGIKDLFTERDLSDLPHAIVLPLEQPMSIANETRHRLYVEPFGFDPRAWEDRLEGRHGNEFCLLAGAAAHARALPRGETAHRRQRDWPIGATVRAADSLDQQKR